MNHQPHRAFLVIPPEVHLLDISGPAHVFYEAKALGANIELHYISLDGNYETVSSAGLSINQLQPFDSYELGVHDWVIVPGLESGFIDDPSFKDAAQPFLSWLSRQADNGAKVCSVCTGAFLLAMAGIFDGKQCTTHWKYIDYFHNKFPKAHLLDDRLFVKDANLYSSAGVSSGIDLSLYLLEEVFGPVFTIKVAKEIVIFLRRAEDDPQLSVFLQYRNHIQNRVHQIQDYLAQHLDKKISIDILSEHIHMSPRNMSRLFKKTTGITIGTYIDKLRVERAVQQLSSGQKVDTVAQACGLKSSNQLRTLLKKYKSALPHELID